MTKIKRLRELILKNKADVISFKELVDLGFNERWLKYALKTLREEKLIWKIKKGLYSRIPLEGLDIFKLANLIFNGYLALTTAAYIYKWIDEYPYTIYVMTKYTSKKIKIKNHEIKSIAAKERFMGTSSFEGYIVSSKAKTLFDLLWYEKFFNKEWLDKLIKRIKIILTKNDKKEFTRYVLMFGNKRIKEKIKKVLKWNLENLH